MSKPRKRFSEIGRSQQFRIVHLLKKSQGLSVTELRSRLGLSYMGVKQHCEALARQGLVDTWRKPKPIGRPEMVYRLTRKAQCFFPQSSNGATIELLHAAKRLYGPAAPEKLLYSLFAAKANTYQKALPSGDLTDRMHALAQQREEEGYFCEFSVEPELAIVEFHSPIFDLMDAFPLVRRLEHELIERVLGVAVSRDEQVASGLYRCRYAVASRMTD
jgi:predicted ArsR family transcriptional regulator